MLFCRIKHRRYMWDRMHQRSQDTLSLVGAKERERDRETALGLHHRCRSPCGNQMQKVFTLVPDSFYTLIVPPSIAREFIGLMDVCCYSVASSSFSRPASSSSPPVHVATMIFSSSSRLESIPGPLVGIHRHFILLSCL